jgi:hypothetical protein
MRSRGMQTMVSPVMLVVVMLLVVMLAVVMLCDLGVVSVMVRVMHAVRLGEGRRRGNHRSGEDRGGGCPE